MLLASLAARRAERSAAVDERVQALEARATGADEHLRRLYKLVEDGVADLDEILKNDSLLSEPTGTSASSRWQGHEGRTVPQSSFPGSTSRRSEQ